MPHRGSDSTCCCNSKDYLGRLQRLGVSNQGTLRVVALIAGMAKLVDALVLGTSAKSVGVRVPLPAPILSRVFGNL